LIRQPVLCPSGVTKQTGKHVPVVAVFDWQTPVPSPHTRSSSGVVEGVHGATHTGVGKYGPIENESFEQVAGLEQSVSAPQGSPTGADASSVTNTPTPPSFGAAPVFVEEQADRPPRRTRHATSWRFSNVMGSSG
jgi:hypothetical protein